MGILACDISYYQPPVDDSYPHRWLIFRCCDGDFEDPRCEHNAEWSVRAVASGRMDGWTAYVVYRPGMNAAVLRKVWNLPLGGHVMIDVESWGGQIRGDHSTEINALVAMIGQRYPGKVWGYGNRYDLAEIWPNRSVPVVVASYGSTKPDVPNMVGWQYYGGEGQSANGLPWRTAPFGACDHNVLYVTPETTTAPAAPEIPAPAPTILEDVMTVVIIHGDKNGSGGMGVIDSAGTPHVKSSAQWAVLADAIAQLPQAKRPGLANLTHTQFFAL